MLQNFLHLNICSIHMNGFFSAPCTCISAGHIWIIRTVHKCCQQIFSVWIHPKVQLVHTGWNFSTTDLTANPQCIHSDSIAKCVFLFYCNLLLIYKAESTVQICRKSNTFTLIIHHSLHERFCYVLKQPYLICILFFSYCLF